MLHQPEFCEYHYIQKNKPTCTCIWCSSTNSVYNVFIAATRCRQPYEILTPPPTPPSSILTRTSPSTGLLVILVMASPLCTVVPSEVSTQLCVSVPSGTESTRTMGVATPTPQTPIEREPTYITTTQDTRKGWMSNLSADKLMIILMTLTLQIRDWHWK